MVNFDSNIIEKNYIRLINQLWKLIPMRENNEDWEKQLDTVILEIAGLSEIFAQNPQFLQLLSKMQGLKTIETEFSVYRKTIFECISLLKECLNSASTQTVDFSKSVYPEINNMATRLNYFGGYKQQDRMILDKRKSLNKAVLYSYQGAFIKKLEENSVQVRGLINPNKNKPDYDEKILSVGFEYNFNSGDIFEWCNTNTFWLIYLQDLTELAYFRGNIRRCRYEISWLDQENNLHSTYAAIRGPVETKINFIQKHQISVDNPNYSLDILMPLNDDTLAYFKRYAKFYLKDQDICWRVEAIDWISTPGILEVVAVEYYANETEDDISNGVVGALMVNDTEINSERIERLIVGDTFIKPKRFYTYTYTGIDKTEAKWEFDEQLPIKYSTNENSITLQWQGSYSGSFTLSYKGLEKTIVVESLF